MDDIEHNEGELTEYHVKSLEINKHQLEDKSVSYLEVIKQKEAFLSTINDELDRLEALKKRSLKLIDVLKSNLLGAVNLFGEFKVGTLTFGKRRSESVVIEDMSSILNMYKTQKTTELPDKAKIKNDIKKGRDVEGAYIQTNYSLKIR